jgi:hypothetical protein
MIEWFTVKDGIAEWLSFEEAKERSLRENIIKFDGYRESLCWTVVGPKGRVGDYATFDEAVEHLNEDV